MLLYFAAWSGIIMLFTEYGDCTTIGKLSITQESHISDIATHNEYPFVSVFIMCSW